MRRHRAERSVEAIQLHLLWIASLRAMTPFHDAWGAGMVRPGLSFFSHRTGRSSASTRTKPSQNESRNARRVFIIAGETLNRETDVVSGLR